MVHQPECGHSAGGNGGQAPQLSQLIDEIRGKISQAYSDNRDLYSENDIRNTMEHDLLVRRYLDRNDGHVDATVDMMVKAYKWRKAEGMSDLCDDSFPQEFYTSGATFRYLEDRDGYPVLYSRLKYSRKIGEINDLVKKFALYMVDQISMHSYAKGGWTMVVDYTDFSIRTFNVWLLMQVMICLGNYSPIGIRKIILCNVPRILSSCGRFVMKLTPEKYRDKFIWCDADNITDHIASEKLPDFLGGEGCNYVQVPPTCKGGVEFFHENTDLTDQQIDNVLRQLNEVVKLNCS